MLRNEISSAFKFDSNPSWELCGIKILFNSRLFYLYKHIFNVRLGFSLSLIKLSYDSCVKYQPRVYLIICEFHRKLICLWIIVNLSIKILKLSPSRLLLPSKAYFSSTFGLTLNQFFFIFSKNCITKRPRELKPSTFECISPFFLFFHFLLSAYCTIIMFRMQHTYTKKKVA